MSKTMFLFVVALGLLWLASPLMAADSGKGNILIEEWTNTGNAVTDNVDTLHAYINAGNQPTRAYWTKVFDRPDGGEDYWGGRFRGYLYPPQTGDYTFWTCSDDDSEIWLSTDENPANVKMICNVEGWMPYLAWDGAGGAPGTTFKSKPVTLTAGKRYYVETFFSDGTGGGFQTVGWGGPGIGAGPVVIDGKYLAPVVRNPEPMFMAQNPDPKDGTVGATMPLMSWTPGATALFHDVYLGTDPNPPKVASRQVFAMFYYIQGLQPGTTYYWRVDEIEADGTTTYKGPVWKFTSEPVKNYVPTPADAATGQLFGITLTWKPGKEAVQHQVYFGTDLAAVTSGAASADKGKVSDAKIDSGALRASTTYYWRVDAIKADKSVAKGDVWSFTTASGVSKKVLCQWWDNIGGGAITDLTNNANYPNNPSGTELRDLFESPFSNNRDNYGTRLYGWLTPPQSGNYTFWIAANDVGQLWLSTDADPTKAKQVAFTSGGTDPRQWDLNASQKSAPIALTAGQKYFIMALQKEGTGRDHVAVAWQEPGIAAQEVIKAQYVDTFALPPLQSFGPTPANGAVDTAQSLDLNWSAGEKAQKHEVYFGEDKAAVAAADSKSPLFKGSQTGTTFNAADLAWGKTYYWRVDETNAGQADSPWKGNVWSFTTANFLPVDNMESYTDQAGSEIWTAWADGFADNFKSSGSTVGIDPAVNGTFGETGIVHGGRQSLPMAFNNTKTPFFSEAVQTFSPLQNWTGNGVTDLSLWVRGNPGKFVDKGNGAFTVGASGHDIWDDADDFRFVYKNLSGNGSITAKVDSLVNTNAWAKAGVMVRETLDASSRHAYMAVTTGNSCSAQRRDAANPNSASTNWSGAAVTAPYWVRITRTGNSFKSESSADGKTWTALGADVTIAMTANVYIGVAVTSHDATRTTTAEISSVATSGGVTGSWQQAWIGDDPDRTNSTAALYVVVEDSTAKTATATNATAVTTAAWTEWKVPLSSLTGVNLAKVKKLTIGVGDKKTPAADGSGIIYVDDIRVSKP